MAFRGPSLCINYVRKILSQFIRDRKLDDLRKAVLSSQEFSRVFAHMMESVLVSVSDREVIFTDKNGSSVLFDLQTTHRRLSPRTVSWLGGFIASLEASGTVFSELFDAACDSGAVSSVVILSHKDESLSSEQVARVLRRDPEALVVANPYTLVDLLQTLPLGFSKVLFVNITEQEKIGDDFDAQNLLPKIEQLSDASKYVFYTRHKNNGDLNTFLQRTMSFPQCTHLDVYSLEMTTFADFRAFAQHVPRLFPGLERLRVFLQSTTYMYCPVVGLLTKRLDDIAHCLAHELPAGLAASVYIQEHCDIMANTHYGLIELSDRRHAFEAAMDPAVFECVLATPHELHYRNTGSRRVAPNKTIDYRFGLAFHIDEHYVSAWRQQNELYANIDVERMAHRIVQGL